MRAGRSERSERIAFIALSALVFAYIAARAVRVPVTHDEAMTFFMYVETGDFLPFRAHWDAGNHLLSTALGWSGYSAFGLHAWALRLPSVLAFVLYAGYAWRWGLALRQPLIRWCFWAALLLMPFLLDFFALFRGYGLALAFWLMAVHELCALLERRSTARLLRTLGAMACAGFSSLSLLTPWAALLAITATVILYRPLRGKSLAVQLGGWVLLGAAPFLFATAYVHELSLRGALYYGVDGLLSGTLPSLLKMLLGSTGSWAVAGILAALGITTLCAAQAVRARDRSLGAWALVVATGLLVAEVAARILLFHWQGTPFPEDRTALHWVPLFLLLFAFSADRLSPRMPHVKWAALLLLVFPLRTLATADLSTTLYWPEQAIPDRIFEAAHRLQRAAPRPLTIGAYHQMPACWGFGMRQRGLRLNAVDATAFPHGGDDLLITDPRTDSVPAGYHLVAVGRSGHVALHERERIPALTLLLDSVLPPLHGDAEFRELWHPSVGSVIGSSFLVQLELAIRPEKKPMTGDLAVVTDAPGAGQHNGHALIQFMRDPARGDSVLTVRRIPRIPADATRTVVFLWNPGHLVHSSSGRMRIYLVDP